MADLTVHIKSFSYKDTYPQDSSDHGGGYVFDCRGLPNPGRDPAFGEKSGLDQEVVDYLEAEPLVRAFYENCVTLVQAHVKVFQERGFDYLSVAFGCTGGQHRSVYCAQTLAIELRGKGITVELEHQKLKEKGWL